MKRALTTNQRHICDLITDGYTDREINLITGFSRNNITRYRREIFIKYNAKNAAHLGKLVGRELVITQSKIH